MRLEEEEEEEEEEPKKKSSGRVGEEGTASEETLRRRRRGRLRPKACVAVQDVCVWTQACISQRLESDDDVDTVAYIYV
jgi:hypothetical protein